MAASFFDDLPDDPEQAFLILEKRFRDDCWQQLRDTNENEFPSEVYLEYMRRVSAAAQELELGKISEWQIPNADDLDIGRYRNFRGDVDHYITTLQIRHSRRESGYTVRLDTKAREIISHHLRSVKDIVQKLEIEDWKREALLYRLKELQDEVDRNRFRYQIYAAFVIESAGIIGVAAEKLEPLRRLIDSVSGLLWGSKQSEKTKSLPRQNPPKQIEPPKPTPPAQRQPSPIDDDIPF